jgi:hypothetical protein
MTAKVFKAEELNLPKHIAKRLKGHKVEFVEINEGVLIKPIEDPIKELRGFQEGSKFTTESYLRQKHQDKALE